MPAISLAPAPARTAPSGTLSQEVVSARVSVTVRVPGETAATVRAAHDLLTGPYREITGQRLALSALLAAAVTDGLAHPRAWTSRVAPDARSTRAYDPARGTLALVWPAGLLTDLDATAARIAIPRVSALAAATGWSLGRVVRDTDRASGGDRRAARALDRWLLNVPGDGRHVLAATDRRFRENRTAAQG